MATILDSADNRTRLSAQKVLLDEAKEVFPESYLSKEGLEFDII